MVNFFFDRIFYILNCKTKQLRWIQPRVQIQKSRRLSFYPSFYLPRKRICRDWLPLQGLSSRLNGRCTFCQGKAQARWPQCREHRCQWFGFLCGPGFGWRAQTWKSQWPRLRNLRKSTPLAAERSEESWFRQWPDRRARPRRRLRHTEPSSTPCRWSGPFRGRLWRSWWLRGWPFDWLDTCPPVTLQVRNIPAYKNADIKMSFPCELTIP